LIQSPALEVKLKEDPALLGIFKPRTMRKALGSPTTQSMRAGTTAQSTGGMKLPARMCKEESCSVLDRETPVLAGD